MQSIKVTLLLNLKCELHYSLTVSDASMFVQNILILAHLRNVKQQILQQAVQLFSAYFCRSHHSQPPISDTVKVKHHQKAGAPCEH